MVFYKTGDCSAEALWENAKQLITETPKGYVDNGNVKHPFWAIASDPLQVPGCQMALVKFLDGSPVAVRWPVRNFVIARMCSRCHRDLDFIREVLGEQGLALHLRAHERDDFIKTLKEIRDNSNESHTRDALNVLIKEYE
jgi:hypothetical protein